MHHQNQGLTRSSAYQVGDAQPSHPFYLVDHYNQKNSPAATQPTQITTTSAISRMQTDFDYSKSHNTPQKAAQQHNQHHSSIKLVKGSPFQSSGGKSLIHENSPQNTSSPNKNQQFAEIKKSQIVFADQDFKTGVESAHQQQLRQSKSPQDQTKSSFKPSRNSTLGHGSATLPTQPTSHQSPIKTSSTKSLQLQSQKSALLKSLTNMLHLSAAFDRELSTDSRFQIFKSGGQSSTTSASHHSTSHQLTGVSGDLSSISAQIVKNCILLKTRAENLNKQDFKILDSDRLASLHQLRRVALSLNLSPSRRQTLNELLDNIDQALGEESQDLRACIDDFFSLPPPAQVQNVIIQARNPSPVKKNSKKVSQQAGAVQEPRQLQLYSQHQYSSEEAESSPSKVVSQHQCSLQIQKPGSTQKQRNNQANLRQSQLQQANQNNNQRTSIGGKTKITGTGTGFNTSSDGTQPPSATPTKVNQRYQSAAKQHVRHSFDPIMVVKSPIKNTEIVGPNDEPMTPPYYNVNQSSVRLANSIQKSLKKESTIESDHQHQQASKKATPLHNKSTPSNTKEMKTLQFNNHHVPTVVDQTYQKSPVTTASTKRTPRRQKTQPPQNNNKENIQVENNENENPNPNPTTTTTIKTTSSSPITTTNYTHAKITSTGSTKNYQSNYMKQKYEFVAREIETSNTEEKTLQSSRTEQSHMTEELASKKQESTDQRQSVNQSNFTNKRPVVDPIAKSTTLSQPSSQSSPPNNAGNQKLTLVLDMDETLLHFDHSRKVYFQRPHVHLFLANMAPLYDMIVFTAGMKDYADWLLDDLDGERHIKKRLYRNSCTIQRGVYYKDLRKLRVDMRRVIIVDNMPENFGLQPCNGIPIKGWYNDTNQDCELLKLSNILQRIHYDFFEAEENLGEGTGDVRTGIAKYIPNCHANRQKKVANASPAKRTSQYGAPLQSASKMRQSIQSQVNQQMVYLNSGNNNISGSVKKSPGNSNGASKSLAQRLSTNHQNNNEQYSSPTQYFNYPKTNQTPTRVRDSVDGNNSGVAAAGRANATSIKKQGQYQRLY